MGPTRVRVGGSAALAFQRPGGRRCLFQSVTPTTQPPTDGPTPPSSHASAYAAASASASSEPVAAIRAIYQRRAAAGPLVAGVAAAAHSDMYKGPAPHTSNAMSWDIFLSRESLAREPCSLKLAGRHLKQPGLISLGGGLPSSDSFPIGELSMRLSGAADRSAAASPPADHRVGSGREVRVGLGDPSYDLAVALNYAQATGSAQLLRFLTEHTELVHRPPYADWRCCATIGSTSAMDLALRMLCDPARADTLLTDPFTFSTVLESLTPLRIRPFAARADAQGLLPDSIDEILSGWDERARNARKPTILYAVPTGQNPTGATMGRARRQAVYDVCRRHNLLIIEDDPYYILQMPPYPPPPAPTAPADVAAHFLHALLPSLLSLDVDGRVLRLDSLSKVVFPGARLGWVTAPRPVIDRFVMHSEVATQGPSGLSQLLLHKLLDQTWGHRGFLVWLASLADRYAHRRDRLLRACEELLPADIVSWDAPAAGMFLWLKLDHAKHPAASRRNLHQLEADIFDACVRHGVLVARGSWFHTDAASSAPLPGLFFRTTFAAATEPDIVEAVRRFGRVVRESFGR